MNINFEQVFTAEDGREYIVYSQYVDYELRLSTCLCDENGKPVAGTESAQDWAKFYAAGWSKKECQNGIKDSWMIPPADKAELLDGLNTIVEDAAQWINWSMWETLPTEAAAAQWFEDDFAPIWDEAKEAKAEQGADFDEAEFDAQLIASCERLEVEMSAKPNLVANTTDWHKFE